MIKYSFIYLLILFANTAISQNCQWAKSGDGSGYNSGYSVCTDLVGNLVVTGSFQGTSINFGGTILNNNGIGNIFITKYNSTGNVLWTKSGLGTGNDWSQSVCADSEDNIYITGHFNSPMLIFDTYTLTPVGSNDVFIVKYDSFGNVLWAKSEGTINFEKAFSIKTDKSNNFYITGYTDNSSITFGSYTLTAPPYTMFLVKYDKNGNVLWANTPSGSAISYAVNTDNNNNVYTTGELVDSIVSFGSHTVIRGNSYANCFVTKYDSLGIAIWAKSNTGRFGNCLTTNLAGETFVIGNYFANTITIGTYTFTNSDTFNNYDVFVVKYDINGNVIWAKSAGNFNNDFGYSIASDVSSIYITGRFNNSISFGTPTLTAPSGSSDPMYIVRLDFNGNVTFQTALTSGGTNFNYQNWVCTDNFQNIYITSAFDSNPFNVGGNILNLTGGRNVFVAKYHFNDVGIKSYNQNVNDKIFPNPNNGLFNVKIDNDIENGELILINSVGQKVHQQKISKKENSVITNGLSKGLYNCIIFFNNIQVSNYKIVIE